MQCYYLFFIFLGINCFDGCVAKRQSSNNNVVYETKVNRAHGTNIADDNTSEITFQPDHDNCGAAGHYIFKVPVSMFNQICHKHPSSPPTTTVATKTTVTTKTTVATTTTPYRTHIEHWHRDGSKDTRHRDPLNSKPQQKIKDVVNSIPKINHEQTQTGLKVLINAVEIDTTTKTTTTTTTSTTITKRPIIPIVKSGVENLKNLANLENLRSIVKFEPSQLSPKCHNSKNFRPEGIIEKLIQLLKTDNSLKNVIRKNVCNTNGFSFPFHTTNSDPIEYLQLNNKDVGQCKDCDAVESPDQIQRYNKISPASQTSVKENIIKLLTRRQKRSGVLAVAALKVHKAHKKAKKKIKQLVRGKRSLREASDGNFTAFVKEPEKSPIQAEDSDCSYTIQLCDVQSKTTDSTRCYSCYCSPISETIESSSKSVYNKYFSRVVDEDDFLQGPQEMKKDEIVEPKDIPINFAYEQFLRALDKKRRRNERSSHDKPSENDFSYNFKKCHNKNEHNGCSDCYNCVCKAIPRDNKTTTTEQTLLASGLKIHQEESDDTRIVDLPKTHNFGDFKNFLKIVLNNTQHNTIPLISMLNDMYETRSNNYEYEAKDYYRPFPEKSNGKISTKNHEYDLSELPTDNSDNINDQPLPTVPPKKRYKLFEQGMKIVHPIMKKFDRKSKKMVGQSKPPTVKNVVANNDNGEGGPIIKGSVFEVVAVEPIERKFVEKYKRLHEKRLGTQRRKE